MDVEVAIFVDHFAQVFAPVLEHDDVEDSAHHFLEVLKVGHFLVAFLVGEGDEVVQVHHDFLGVVAVFSEPELDSALPQQVILVVFPVVDVEIFDHVFDFLVDIDGVCLRVLVAEMV